GHRRRRPGRLGARGGDRRDTGAPRPARGPPGLRPLDDATLHGRRARVRRETRVAHGARGAGPEPGCLPRLHEAAGPEAPGRGAAAVTTQTALVAAPRAGAATERRGRTR